MIVSICAFWKKDRENIPQLEVLASLQCQLCLGLASCALQSQHNLLGGLSLLVENWLGLTTITGLLAIITTLSLSEKGSLKYMSSCTLST